MLQAAGAHVIPIQWDLPLANITALLSQIDGVYFPGGSASLWDATTMNKTDFGLAVNNILTQIIQINTNGDFLPFMGTCLGMSMIATAFAPNLTLYLPGVDVWNVSKPIFFTALLKTSTLFQGLDSNTISEMQTLNMAFFHTMFLINSTIWFQNNTLSGNFSVTAVAIDGNNTSFAAVIEGIHMPVYATQFHYEKNTYEWDKYDDMPQNRTYAVKVQQQITNVFVNQTRKCNHTMTMTMLQNLSMLNYNAFHFGVSPEYERVYLFSNYAVHNISDQDV